MSVPGAAPPPERLPDGPRPIGPFTLTATVAAGRRTTTFLAFREGSNVPLIVREVVPGRSGERFEAELAAAGAVRIGTPLAPVTCINDRYYAEAPAIVGESLATILDDALDRGEPLNLHLALTIAMGIAEQLERVGSLRFHGDLAPHHVLVGYDGTVTLIDPAGEAYRERSAADGRAGYRSPEHVDDAELGPGSDVFVLGILLFEMTTGQRLFDEPTREATDARIIEGNMPRPRDIIGDGYPIELQLVLRKLMRPSMSGRFNSARAARDALRLVATTRSDVGPEALGAWMESRFADRQRRWDDLLEPSTDQTRSRPSSRAATALTGPPRPLASQPAPELGRSARDIARTRPTGVATLQDESLESVVIEEARDHLRSLDESLHDRAIDREIGAIAAAHETSPGTLEALPTDPPVSSDSAAFRAAIPAEPTQPNALATLERLELETLPDPDSDVDDDSLPDDIARAEESGRVVFSPNHITPIEPPPEPTRNRRQLGMKQAPPRAVIPDLPTEVGSSRAAHETRESVATTALDEIAAEEFIAENLQLLQPGGPPALNIEDGSNEDNPAPRAQVELEETPLPLDRPTRPSTDVESTRPLEDLEAFDAPLTDRAKRAVDRSVADDIPAGPPPRSDTEVEPLPSPLDDGVVPEQFAEDEQPATDALSNDLVLDETEDVDDLTEDMDPNSPDLISDLWELMNVESEGPNDTIDDQSAADILTPDELALMQRAAEIVEPPKPFEIPEDEDDDDASFPPLPSPRAPMDRNATPPMPGMGAAPSEMTPFQPEPLAPLAPPPASDRPNQRGIATQVVRDRIADNRGPVPSASFEERDVPTQVVRDRVEVNESAPDLEPPGPARPTLVDPLLQEDSQNSDLVIPLSDDDLERSERKRRFLVAALILAPALVAALGFVVYDRFLQDRTAVAIPSEQIRIPGEDVTGAGAPPPARAAPIDTPPPAADAPPPIEAAPPPPAGPPPRIERAAPPPRDKPTQPDVPPAIAPPPPVETAPPPPVETAPPPPVETAPPVDTPPPPVDTPPPPVETAPPPVEAAPPVDAPPPIEPAPVGPTQVRVRLLPEAARFKVSGVEYDNNSIIEIGDEPVEVEAFLEGHSPKTYVLAPGRTQDLLMMLTRTKTE